MLDFSKCTLQEACDYAVKKMVAQKSRCKDGEGCLYFDGDRRCAVGWLLDAGGLTEEDITCWGGVVNLVRNSQQRLPPKLRSFLEAHALALAALQRFHDKDSRAERAAAAHDLQVYHGVDTSGEAWQEWVKLDILG